MVKLTEWSHWRTERTKPSENTKMHVCSRVTIHELTEFNGRTWVKYGYTDYTYIGTFSGRDGDYETDFRNMFPVKED